MSTRASDGNCFSKFIRYVTPDSFLHVDGDYVAHVVTVGGALGNWSYTVFRQGRVVDAACSYNLGAFDACRLALAAIEAHKEGVIQS